MSEKELFTEETSYKEAFTILYKKLDAIEKTLNDVNVKADRTRILIEPAIKKLEEL